jgi:hypothetical protein
MNARPENELASYLLRHSLCTTSQMNKPSPLDGEDATADFADGLLTIKLSKVDGPDKKPIEVQAKGPQQ